MIYGYARCSTNESLQDIDRQVRELKQQGAEEKTIYREYESGTKVNRVELQKLLDIVKPGDTILNRPPFVRQYGILLMNGVLFYAKRDTK